MASLILRFNEGDAAVTRGANGLKDMYGFNIVVESYLNTHRDQGVLSAIGENEWLVIHGHGSPTDLGGKSVTKMAKFLADNGLKGPVQIALYACEGGLTGAPFALELKVALVQGHKIMCSVSGAKGILYRNRTTGNWTVGVNGGRENFGTGSSIYATTKSF
jgi:hypothetical protein